MAMKQPSTSPQKKQRRNDRMTRTQGQGETKKIKSMDTKDDGDRDVYRLQQKEHRGGEINSGLYHNAATASESLGDLGTNQDQADDVEMTMSSTQNQQQGSPEKEFQMPMKNRTDSVGRIHAPHDHDVLCGRGGSINSHPGNITFREWVYKRKTRYNLANSKRDKTIVVNEVLSLVRALKPPGRFLQKFNTDWIEIDDAKAMAKISQALREGAPAMRAAHGKKATKRRSSDSARSPSPQRRESKRRAKKRKFDDYVPSEEIPAGENLSSSIAAVSSAPLTPPPSLEGNEDHYHHDDLMKNDAYNYFDNTGGLNDLLLEQSNGALAVAGRDLQPQGGNYNGSFISPSYSHPLVPFGDYRVSLSEVANAIPPTQNEEKLHRANNVTPNLTSLPPPPFSPGGWDPLSFLPSTPKLARAAVEGMNGQSFFPLTPVYTPGTATMPTSPDDANAQGQAFSLQQKPSSVRREHSLEASLGSFSNPLDNGSNFSNPFENDSNHFRQYPLPALPIPNHIGQPQRGLSFGTIGGLPKAKEINASSRRDTSSHSSNKSYSSSSQDERKHPPL